MTPEQEVELVVDGRMVVLTFGMYPYGRWTCISVRCPAGVDGGLLRQIPMAKICDRLARKPERPETGGPTDEALQRAAVVYRRYWQWRANPTNGVARELALTQRQATYWVTKARERGYLPPTSQGKAGA